MIIKNNTDYPVEEQLKDAYEEIERLINLCWNNGIQPYSHLT